MKKILTIIIAFVVALSLGTVSWAADGEDVTITAEEYAEILKNEAVKMGLDCKILNYDKDELLTYSTLYKSITALKDSCLDNFEVSENLTEEENLLDDRGNGLIKAMPITITRYGYFTTSNGYGMADMCVEANVISDAQSGRITSVNYINVYQQGYFINYVGWTTTSISRTLNSPSAGYLAVNIVGRLTCSYADPYSSITMGVTTTESATVTIDCR